MILRTASLAILVLTLSATAQTTETTPQVPLPPPQEADPETMTIHAGDPASVVAALHELGFRAKLTEDEQGDPKIKSAASGVSFSVYFYACDDDHTNCRDLLLYTIFNYEDGFTARPINDWNEDKVIGAAFLDEENDPGLQHFIAGVYDMNLESFERTMIRWEAILDEFTEFIDW